MPTLGNERRGSLDPMFQKQAGDGTPTWESGKLLLVRGSAPAKPFCSIISPVYLVNLCFVMLAGQQPGAV
jgi:hypothetical protein